MRRSRFVLALAGRRLRRPASGAVLALGGVAAASAFLGAVVLGSGIARERSIGRSVTSIPADARGVRAVWFGVPSGEREAWPALDAESRAALGPVGLGEATPLVLVRESTVAGRFVGIAGVVGLRPHVVLRTGRLPRRCLPARCEVLRLRGAGALPSAPGLRLVQVGTASLRSRQLFGDFLQPTDNALADAAVAPALARAGGYHRPAPAPLVVAEGVEALAGSPALARSYRSYAWVLPLSDGRPRAGDVAGVVAGVDRARASLRTASSAWSVTAPTQELQAARSAALVAGRRLLLVGGQGAALLVAFALLAAGTIRADAAAARRRLAWSGARRWETHLLGAAESLGLGLGGALAGWVAALALGGLASATADVPAGMLLRETLLAPGGLALALGAALASGLALWAVASVNTGRSAGRWLAAAALGALVLASALLLGGSLDVSRLRESGTAAGALLLLPGLIGFAGAVLATRALPLAGGRIAALGRARPGVALAGAGVTRGASGFAVAFLTLAIGLAVLAAGYRATLARGERDQAAFRVPTDVVVREDLATLVPVDEVATAGRLATLVGDGRAARVLRISTSAGAAERIGGVTLLGLPPDALRELPLWRADWGAAPRRLAAELAPRVDPALRGVRLAGRSVLEAELGPTLVSLRALVAAPGGRYGSVLLGPSDPRRRVAIRVDVPPRLRGGTLVALELVPPPRLIERGADAGVAYRGSVDLRLAGADLSGWLGEQGAAVWPRAGGVRIAFALTPQRRTRIRARQASDDELPRVAVTPRLAALAGGVGGRLALLVGGGRTVVRVVQEIERFPGAGADAVIGDAGSLRSAVDTVALGSGGQTELWLRVARGDEPRVLAALALPPFASLAVASRSALLADARRDPLSRGTLLTLLAGAVVAVGLAVLGLVLVVRAALRDEGDELLDLEAQGASPALLLRVVRMRVAIVGAVGAVLGVGTGLILLGLVGRIVTVTSGAQAPEPPLAVTLGPVAVLLAGLVVAGVAATAVLLATRAPAEPGRRSA